MSNSDYRVIRRDIRLYARDMNQWWKKLKDDSVAEWTLLTTFGCWGIPNHYFQLASFMLTILFFSGKLFKIKHKYSFYRSETIIIKKITEANINVLENDKLLEKLNKVKKFRQNRNTPFIIKRNWRFILSYIFLMTSFIHNIFPWIFKH